MIKNLIRILILFCLSFSFEKHNIDQTHFNRSSIFDSEYNKTNKLFHHTNLNRGYNLLAYESHNERVKAWENFRNDPEWQKVVEDSHKDGIIVKKVHNQLLNPTDYSPLQ